MDIEELSEKIDKYQGENKKREEKGRYENLSLVSLGLGIAVIGFVFSTDNIVSIIFYCICACYFLFFAIRTYIKIQKMK